MEQFIYNISKDSQAIVDEGAFRSQLAKFFGSGKLGGGQ